MAREQSWATTAETMGDVGVGGCSFTGMSMRTLGHVSPDGICEGMSISTLGHVAPDVTGVLKSGMSIRTLGQLPVGRVAGSV